MGSPTQIATSHLGKKMPEACKIRVMIVDDSLTVRAIMARIINAEPDLEVVGKCSSAELALGDLKRTPADVVLLDLEMPGMGGLNALPKLLASRDGLRVLVISTLAQAGAEATLTALSLGAADTMAKPCSGGFDRAYCETLFAKIRALGPRESQRQSIVLAKRPPTRPRQNSPLRPELLAIGASTGGIHALCLLLKSLPKQFDLPILVTQHLPDSFMQVFARQLELASSREAVIAEDNMLICRNRIHIAPGNGHLNIRKSVRGLTCHISRETTESGCMPSVDPMLRSLAEATEGRAVGVILSGMGKDGASGASELVARGGSILAQDEESCAVWGMPRAVTELGLASAVLPPDQLAAKLMASIGAAAWK